MNIVPSTFKTAIKPSDIFVATNVPAIMAMMNTLGKCEYEATAAAFVVNSQYVEQWAGFTYENRADSNGVFAEMVELGFIAEQQTDSGWNYELSRDAIEQIFVRQSVRQIRDLQAQLRWAREESLMRRIVRLIKKLFSVPPAFA